MIWFDTRKRRFRSRVELVGPSRAELERASRLREEKHGQPGRDGAARSNAELGADGLYVNTATMADRDAVDLLTAGQDSVVDAAAAASMVAQEQAAVAADPGRAARYREHLARQTEAMARRFDHSRPLAPGWFLTAAEVIAVLIEWAFWNAVFSRDIEPVVPFYGGERLSAALLAAMLPLVGVVAARWFGATWQRFLRHPIADDRRQRLAQALGAAASAALLGVVVATVFALVDWRYREGVGLGALQIPATWMALAFTAIVVADAVARTFLTSEQAEQDRRRDTAWSADRATERQLAAGRTRADAAWVHTWLALRGLVIDVLDHTHRLAVSEALLILDHRAADQHGPATGPAARPAAPVTPWARGPAGWHRGLLVPDPVAPRLLELPVMPTVLRAVEAAVDTLRVYLPPQVTPDQQTAHLIALLDTLHAPAPDPGPQPGGGGAPVAAAAGRNGRAHPGEPNGSGPTGPDPGLANRPVGAADR